MHFVTRSTCTRLPARNLLTGALILGVVLLNGGCASNTTTKSKYGRSQPAASQATTTTDTTTTQTTTTATPASAAPATTPVSPSAPTQSTPVEPTAGSATRQEPQAVSYSDVLKQEQAARARVQATKESADTRTAGKSTTAAAANKPEPNANSQAVPQAVERPTLNPRSPLRPPETSPEQTAAEKQVTRLDTKSVTNGLPESVVEQPAPAVIRFSLDQLPLTIAGTWILKAGQDECSLQTVPVTMDDGAGKTPLFLTMNEAGWMINTKSDIDLTYPDTGLFFSNGTQIKLEELVKDTTISIQKQKQQLTAALQSASSVRVALGFWPSWPVTETRSQSITVAHFPQAYQAWETCNQRVRGR